MSTMHYEYAGDIMIVVHRDEAPGDDEWAAYVAEMERATRAGEMRALLILTPGVGPNAKQRNVVTSMWKRVGENPPTAVITPSRFVRGVITALNYFLPRQITAFSPGEELEAVACVGGAPATRDAILERLGQLNARLAS
ncbi:MAG: hypothetical protein AAFP04_03035 [Myxococcota bacterium]